MRFLYGGTFPYNIGVINIPAENYRLSTAEYYWLYDKLKDKSPYNIVSLMDNDKTGFSEAYHLRKQYRIPAVLIPKSYSCKDFSELRAKYGSKECTKFIVETIKYIKHYVKRIEYIRNKKEDDSCPF